MVKPRNVTKKKESTRKKKKKWYSVKAPKEYRYNIIGESTATEPSQLKGRTLRLSLTSLTGDPKKQNIAITLKVTNITGESCETQLIKYEVNKAHIKKISKKATTKIDDSFLVKTKDGKGMRVKPVFMTRYKTHNSISTAIRKSVREYVLDYCKNHISTDIFSAIIFTNINSSSYNIKKSKC